MSFHGTHASLVTMCDMFHIDSYRVVFFHGTYLSLAKMCDMFHIDSHYVVSFHGAHPSLVTRCDMFHIDPHCVVSCQLCVNFHQSKIFSQITKNAKGTQ